jgi:hypothetical protein
MTMRFLIVASLFLGLFAALAFGQTFEVKDQHGILVVTVENVKMFRHSDYFKEDIPAFEATIKNVVR